MKYKFLALILLLAISFFTDSTLVSAQAVGAQVTPRVIDKVVAPRDIFTEEITVTNDQHYIMSIYPTVNSVDTNGTGDLAELIAPVSDDRANSVTSWISIRQAGIDIKPGETITIPLSVNINPKAGPGKYHAFIGLAGGRNRPEAQAKVAAGNAPGVLLRLEIVDTKTEKISLDGFSVDRFVHNAFDQTVSYTIENPGDKVVTPSGEVIFYNSRGGEVGSVPVNPDNLTLEPGSSLTLKTTSPTGGVMGKYKAYLSVDYGKSQLASVYDTAFFYYVPWKQLIILFTILGVVALFTYWLLSRRFRTRQYVESHTSLPLHVYEGNSEPIDHDINLKNK